MQGKQKKVDERRLFEVEVRLADTGDDATPGVIEGRAAPFHVRAPINGNYLEVLTPETFRASVESGEGASLPLLRDHENHTRSVVGKVLSWRVADDGLWGSWQLDLDSEQGVEVHRQIRDGFVRGLSVGFVPGEDDSVDFDGDVPVVTRGPARLREVSVVAAGAYELAQITLVRTKGVPSRVDPRITQYRRMLEGVL